MAESYSEEEKYTTCTLHLYSPEGYPSDKDLDKMSLNHFIEVTDKGQLIPSGIRVG